MQLPYQQGQYILVEEVARGGMAAVYRAQYRGSQGYTKEVAIKRILPQWSNDASFTAMLIDEAKILTKLEHPNIVQTFELGTDAGQYFLAMEYVAGLDLRTFLYELRSRHVNLPLSCAFTIITAVLQALHFAHTQCDEHGEPLELVHRDISPQNILIAFHGGVKVVDFGIAKGGHRSAHTSTTHIKGKYAYMAPEQASGALIDHRADLYAAGLVCYELIAGRRVFDGPNDLSVLSRVREGKLPRGWLQQLPEALRPVLSRALAYDPGDRYQTAAEFLHALCQFAHAHALTFTSQELAEFTQGALADIIAVQREPKSELLAAEASESTVNFTMSANAETGAVKKVLRSIICLLTCVLLAGVSRHGPMMQAVSLARDVAPTALAPGKLYVQARPWAYVSVSDYPQQLETPAQLSLPPGQYRVRFAAGQGRRAGARAVIRSGKATHCQARLLATPRAWCH